MEHISDISIIVCYIKLLANSLTVTGDFKGTSNCTNVSCTETAIGKILTKLQWLLHTSHYIIPYQSLILYTEYIGDQFTDHCSGGDEERK